MLNKILCFSLKVIELLFKFLGFSYSAEFNLNCTLLYSTKVCIWYLCDVCLSRNQNLLLFLNLVLFIAFLINK